MMIRNETSRRLRLSRSKYITKRLLADEHYIAYVTGYGNGRVDGYKTGYIDGLEDAEMIDWGI